jgi:hypothetical protein
VISHLQAQNRCLQSMAFCMMGVSAQQAIERGQGRVPGQVTLLVTLWRGLLPLPAQRGMEPHHSKPVPPLNLLLAVGGLHLLECMLGTDEKFRVPATVGLVKKLHAERQGTPLAVLRPQPHNPEPREQYPANSHTLDES